MKSVLQLAEYPPRWLLALRLGLALALLGLGMIPDGEAARIVLHALGWLLASVDIGLRLRSGPRVEPMMWLSASLSGVIAGFSGAGLVCAIAARAAWEWIGWLSERMTRRQTAAMDILPKNAEVYRGGAVITVPPDQIEMGDAVIVQPGTTVPADCVVVKGESMVIGQALSGGPETRVVRPRDTVLAGERSETGLLAVMAQRVGGETLAMRARGAMTGAADTVSAPEQRLRRICVILAVAAAGCAVALAVVPPLIWQGGVRLWIGRAAGLLMAACPLGALSYGPFLRARSVYAAADAGGRAAPDTLWSLGRAELAALDDAGVHLPDSRAVVGLELEPDTDRDTLLRCAAIAYAYDEGPLRDAVREYCGDAGGSPDNRETFGGRGVLARTADLTVCAGSAAFLRSRGIECAQDTPSVVRLAADGRLLGGLRIGSRFRPGAESLVKALSALNMDMAFLSPEPHEEASLPAMRLGVRDIHAGVAADARARVFSELLAESRGHAVLVGGAPDDETVFEDGGLCAIPGAWNDAAETGLARGRILLSGPSPEPLGRLIQLARDWRRLALLSVGAAALLSAAGIVLTMALPSWLWFVGVQQAVFSGVLAGLAARPEKQKRGRRP